MRLYDLDRKYEDLLFHVSLYAEEHGGEIPPNAFEMLSRLDDERDSKLGSIGRVIKNLAAYEEALEGEIRSLEQKKKTTGNKIAWLKSYVLQSLISRGAGRFEDAAVTFSLGTSTSVDILDESLVPDAYCDLVRQIRKSSIRPDLDAGADVPGVRLVKKSYLKIK